jgi:hypothetical protein
MTDDDKKKLVEIDFSKIEQRIAADILIKGDWIYVGDGVYAKKDQSGIWLHANDHLNPTDKIYLEWAVFEALDILRR